MQNATERHTSLEATLSEIQALMERQEIVSQLVAREQAGKQELVQSLVARQHAVELETKLNRLHPADAAFVLESLPAEQRDAAWQLIHREQHGAILLELAEAVQSDLIELLSDDELIGLGKQLPSTDFADLVENLPEERAAVVLARLGAGERQQVQTALSFPEDSVGALMEPDAVTVRDDLTLEEATASLRGRRGLPEQLTSIFVVDRENVLQGVLPLARLLLGEPGVKVAAVMDADPVHFTTSDKADEAAQAFERYDLIAAPVVNLHRHVVGWITVDKVRRPAERGLVQAVPRPGGPRRELGPVRAGLAERAPALDLARAQPADGVRRLARDRRVRGLDREARGARRADADRREHRRQHGQPDGGAGGPRPRAVAAQREQPALPAAQGAVDQRC